MNKLTEGVIQYRFLPDEINAIVTPTYFSKLSEIEFKKLTIPKWVADELDENYEDNQDTSWYNSPLSQKVLDWYENDNKNWYIANIYINSKELGIDLVEVVE